MPNSSIRLVPLAITEVGGANPNRRTRAYSWPVGHKHMDLPCGAIPKCRGEKSFV